MNRVLLAALLALTLLSCRTPLPTCETRGPGGPSRVIEPLPVKRVAQSNPTSLDDVPVEDPVPVPPQPTGAMDLRVEGVRELALVGNLGLQVQRFAPHIARETLNAERAKFDAVLGASIRAARDDQFGGRPGAVTGAHGLVIEPSVRLPLRSGGTVTIGLPLTYDSTEYDGFPDEEANNAALNFSYSQPLLRGAGSFVNTASIRVASLQTRQAEAKTRLYAIRVLANAERAYWDLYAAEKETEIRRTQYGLAIEQRDQALRRVAEGAVPKVESDRAHAGVARRIDGVIVAETIRRRFERELKVILNLDDLAAASPQTIHVATNPLPLGLELDRAALMHHAVRNRMEMLDLELQVAIDEVTIGVDRNQTLPNLALEFDYSFRGQSTGGLFTAIDRLQTNNLGDVRLALNYSQPIGSRAARARLRRSVFARGRTLADKKRQEQEIRQEVLDAVDQLEQNWQRVLAARQDVLFSARTYEGEKRQFQLGARTTTEVLEALDLLSDARSREVRALAEYQRAMVEIAFATGTVLGMSRVSW